MQFIIAIIGVSVILVILVVLVINSDNQNNYPIEYYASNMQSGDLILFRHDQMSPITKFVFGDEFSHCAIIYMKNNIPYLLDSNATSSTTAGYYAKSGPSLLPAEPILSAYQGRILIRRLIHDQRISLDDERLKLFDKNIKRYLDESFNIPYLEYVKSCIFGMESKYAGPAYCSMYIYRVLQDLQLINATTQDVCMRPQFVANLEAHSEFQDGYHYGPITELQFI